jgi:N-alpha-acetyltransferase 15/16, NatA auxiliary subunit
MAQALPPKEQGLFKSVVRLYETKMFKKAIKTADQILKRFPEHGETLAMKGLTVNQLDRKEEAHDLVRRGLRKDMKSHICWHVYGLLYRSDHDYHQAARSYVNALRLDPDNQQILLDLALLQVQIRDYEGFEESRRKLLNARPNQKTNWIGVAIAFHLQANYDKTLEVVKTYLKTLSTDAQRAQDPFEHSELLLYRVSVLEEAGDFAGALTRTSASCSTRWRFARRARGC